MDHDRGGKNLNESKKWKAELISEIEKWIFDTEKDSPGALTWFDMEFKRKFPEFDEWVKKKIAKSRFLILCKKHPLSVPYPVWPGSPYREIPLGYRGISLCHKNLLSDMDY